MMHSSSSAKPAGAAPAPHPVRAFPGGAGAFSIPRGVVAAALGEMSNMVCRFHPDTKFNVIAYRDGADMFKPAMAFATQQDKQVGALLGVLGWKGKSARGKTPRKP